MSRFENKSSFYYVDTLGLLSLNRRWTAEGESAIKLKEESRLGNPVGLQKQLTGTDRPSRM